MRYNFTIKKGGRKQTVVVDGSTAANALCALVQKHGRVDILEFWRGDRTGRIDYEIPKIRPAGPQAKQENYEFQLSFK